MAGKTALDLLQEGAAAADVEQLGKFLDQRAEMRVQQDILAERLGVLNTAISMLMGLLKVKSFEGLSGTLVYKSAGVSKSFDKKKLVTGLMNRKVDPSVIAEAIEEATGEKPKPATVSFYKAGEKDES